MFKIIISAVLLISIFASKASVIVAQTVTPSILNTIQPIYPSALVSNKRHSLIPSSIEFSSLFNQLLILNNEPSDDIYEEAYDPSTLNAFFFGASLNFALLNNAEIINTGGSTGFKHEEQRYFIKFNLGNFYAQLTTKRLKEDLNNSATSQEFLGADIAYLMFDLVTMGISINQIYERPNDISIYSFTTSVSANVYDIFYLAVRYGFENLFLHRFGTGIGIESQTNIFSLIKIEFFLDYSINSLARNSSNLFQNSKTQGIKLGSTFEAQIKNFSFSYDIFKNSLYDNAGTGSSTILQDSIAFNITFAGSFFHIGVAFTNKLTKTPSDVRSLRTISMHTGFLF